MLRQHVEDAGSGVARTTGLTCKRWSAAASTRTRQKRPRDAAAFLAELEAAAERRFGAGWLERASIAGIVAGVAGVAAGGAALTAGGATVAGAAPTVVIDSSAISTGAATVGKVAGKGLKWPMIVGAAAVVVIAGSGAAVVINNNSGGSSGASGTTTTSPTTSTPTTSDEPTVQTTAPGGKYVLVQKVISTDFQGGKVGQTVTRTWIFHPTNCGTAKCAGTIKSSSGSSFTYTWNGDTLVLGKSKPYVYTGECVNVDTGHKIPGSHFKATQTYTNTPFVATRHDADGIPTQFQAFQSVREVTSDLSQGCKDRDGVNHSRNKMTLTVKHV